MSVSQGIDVGKSGLRSRQVRGVMLASQKSKFGKSGE